MAPSMNGRIFIDGRNFHNILAYISLTTIGTYYSWAATIGGISVNEKDCSDLTITTVPASEAFIAAYYLDAASCMTFGDRLS